MDPSDERRSFGSYLSRVFAIIVVLVLLLLAVWFVVQIATGGEDEPDQGETTSVNDDASVIDEALSQPDSSAGRTAGESDIVATGGDENGRTLSTNTDDLPDTGAGDMVWILALGALAFSGHSYLESRKNT